MLITYEMFKRGEYKIFNPKGEEISGVLELNLETMKADIVSTLSILSTDLVFPNGEASPLEATVNSEPRILRNVDLAGCRVVRMANGQQNK